MKIFLTSFILGKNITNFFHSKSSCSLIINIATYPPDLWVGVVWSRDPSIGSLVTSMPVRMTHHLGSFTDWDKHSKITRH